MGLSIGQIPAALAGLRSSPEFGRVRLREDTDPSIPRRAQSDEQPALGLGRREETLPRAGFGEGTLSPQGAALRTVNRTIEESRRALPSLDDIRSRFQANAAEARREAQEASLAARREERPVEQRPAEDRPAIQRVERRIPEASAQARRFINDVNDAAAQAIERTGGEVPVRPTGASIEIRGERTPITERDDRTRIDVRV